jgi:hypothetical protein
LELLDTELRGVLCPIRILVLEPLRPPLGDVDEKGHPSFPGVPDVVKSFSKAAHSSAVRPDQSLTPFSISPERYLIFSRASSAL